MTVKIVDVTLRDGEQTPGIAFSENEKLNVAQFLLSELKVDRVEVASARVSAGEQAAVCQITQWAKSKKLLDKIEILGFIDEGKSVDWIEQAGGQVVNFLAKGSLKHVKQQLRKNPQEHLANIKDNIKLARAKGMKVNLYLEDWSNGMKSSPQYVFSLLDGLVEQGVAHFMLADTLGVLNPTTTFDYCQQIIQRYPKLKFDFHGHNDYELGVANSLSAVGAGAKGVHVAVNGLGERAGNVSLASLVVSLKDQARCQLNINEKKLAQISRLVEVFTGTSIPDNKPVVGKNVFTQCCGVHADGDSKGNLYCNDLLPERFSRERRYGLGKMSGKANIIKNLDQLGISLNKQELKAVVNRVVELGDKKEEVTLEDLPFIITDVLEMKKKKTVGLLDLEINHKYQASPRVKVCLAIAGKKYCSQSKGGGQYDAFLKAAGKTFKKLAIELPELVDYQVRIPPGGSSESLVETVITWREQAREFTTKGLDTDQVTSSIKATLKMFNIIVNK
ncbi:2-isopropylmalate synthase [Patescibacteria group bacterium]|nr:2-isopropylmalate synthase [Patescibacteria group bacterium]